MKFLTIFFLLCTSLLSSEEKKFSKIAETFLKSTDSKIHKNFKLQVLYFKQQSEESYWTLAINPSQKEDEKKLGSGISRATSINGLTAKNIIAHLKKNNAFSRSYHWADGRPREGWTVYLNNGDSNLCWFIKDMHEARDMIDLSKHLKDKPQKLWLSLVAKAKELKNE